MFQLIQKKLRILGITKPKSIHSLHGNKLIGWFLLGTAVIMHLTFFFGEANNFREYAESIYWSSLTAVCFSCYTSMILKHEKFFKLIDGCDNLIVVANESEYQIQ